MARASVSLRALNGGELSPRVSGRSDLPNYSASAESCLNFFPLVQGPVMRRSGFRFVKEVKDSSKATALLPFVVSTDASYVIEAGDLYFRFYTEEGRLEVAGVPVEVVTPYTSAEVFELQIAQSADVLYLVHPSHAPRTLTRTSVTTFVLAVIDFLDGPYEDENTDTTKTIQITAGTGASGSSNTITAVGHTPFLAVRDVGRHIRFRADTSGQTSWAKITAVTSTTEVTATVLSANAMDTTVEYRWRLGVWYVGNYPNSVTFHEQRLCFAGAPNSVQRVDLSVSNEYERFSPNGSIDDTNFPYADQDIFADNGIGYVIGSAELNAILWLRVHRRLTLGTSQALFEMAASSQGEAITPDNANILETDMTGTVYVPPARMANTILFVGRDGRSLHAAGFALEEDSTVASHLTELADHVSGDGIVQIAVTAQPIPLVWICTSDGQLASLTLQPRQKVFAWARHRVGGTLAKTRSICGIPTPNHDQLWAIHERRIGGVRVQYVEFLEQPFRILDFSEAQEEAFFVDSGVSTDDPVAITGATQASPVVVTAPSHGFADGTVVRIRGVEGMTELNGKTFTVQAAALHTFELAGVDGLAYGEYTTGGEAREMALTFSGLDHLEGETVSVLADGAVRPDEVVAGGAITLASSASEVHAGLASPALWVSQRLDTDERDGPTGGKSRAFDAVTLRLLDTLGGEIGAGEQGPFAALPYRTGADAMDAAPPLFTGEKRLTFPGGWTQQPRVSFRQAAPLPATVLSITLFGEVGGR